MGPATDRVVRPTTRLAHGQRRSPRTTSVLRTPEWHARPPLTGDMVALPGWANLATRALPLRQHTLPQIGPTRLHALLLIRPTPLTHSSSDRVNSATHCAWPVTA